MMATTFDSSMIQGRAGDPSPLLRAAMIAGGGLVTAASAVAIGRWAAGVAPDAAVVKQVAVIVHLLAVLPAVPMGLVVMLRRKGGQAHRMLGRIWMALMLVTALSAIFIRELDGGGFSWLHIFVPVVIVTAVRAVAAARAGRIDQHKRMMVSFYLGALVVPGLAAFLPGRLMWLWLVG
jgi:uncharacterized membrane protein